MKTIIYFVIIVVFVTLSCTKISTSPDDSLAAPSNLTLEQIDLESIRLTWQDNSSAEDSFRIDRKIGEEEWEENYQIIPENTTTFVDSELVSIGNYFYRISAYSNDDYSNNVEANIDFFYDDVYSISSLFNGQINIELYQSFAFNVILKDSLENIVQRDYEVWFKLLSCPQGFNINYTLFGTNDSLSVQSHNGQAVVSLNAGSQSGIASIKIYVYNSNNEEISVIKSNIVIYSGFPNSVNFSIGEINSGVNMGIGSWEIEVSALLLDSQGNPICDGTAVWFSLPDNPEWASIMPAAYIGNVNVYGDSIPGVAFTRLTYQGSHTNETINIRLETGLGDTFEDELILPIQFPVIDISVSNIHLEWFTPSGPDSLIATLIIQLQDGQNNPIDNQQILFSCDLGNPIDMGTDNDNDPYTENTGIIPNQHGQVNKDWIFYRDECPPPVGNEPGTITAIMTITVIGTSLETELPITLFRYP